MLAGAGAILFPNLAQDGPAATAIASALARRGVRPHLHETHCRARLDARGDAATLLRNALGPKKLKELRRQRNRLADPGRIPHGTLAGRDRTRARNLPRA